MTSRKRRRSQKLKRFWLSWEEPLVAVGDVDWRPNGQYPPPSEVKRYWNTGFGEREYGRVATICAVVDATSEVKAWEAIRASWPDMGAVRFCKERALDWRPHGGRFPWPEERNNGPGDE